MGRPSDPRLCRRGLVRVVSTICTHGIHTTGSGVAAWKSNAHLIAEGVVPLGYIRDTDVVVDVTYGRGLWWSDYRPEHLIAHDIAHDNIDFRDLPEESSSVDVVVFDPPYIAMGGRATSTLGDFADRYGLIDAPKNPEELSAYIAGGLAECVRIVKPSGIILAKSADYVSSGKLYMGTHALVADALALGLSVVDYFVVVASPRAQPHSRQVHARHPVSYLHVLRAGRRRTNE